MDTKMYDACLTKVLKRIYNIDSLLVAVQTLKEIANTPSTLEMLPTIFRNLRDVVVEDTGNITTSESVKAMATILRALPCTQVFVWHRQNEPHISTKDEGLPTQCVLSTLKKFQIEDAHGMEEELAFVEYILKGAICLKELLLTTPKNRKLPTQFCQKLSELSQASSSAVIRYGDVKCSYSSWYESIQE